MMSLRGAWRRSNPHCMRARTFRSLAWTNCFVALLLAMTRGGSALHASPSGYYSAAGAPHASPGDNDLAAVAPVASAGALTHPQSQAVTLRRLRSADRSTTRDIRRNVHGGPVTVPCRRRAASHAGMRRCCAEALDGVGVAVAMGVLECDQKPALGRRIVLIITAAPRC
jgi:hypothetical protein